MKKQNKAKTLSEEVVAIFIITGKLICVFICSSSLPLVTFFLFDAQNFS